MVVGDRRPGFKAVKFIACIFDVIVMLNAVGSTILSVLSVT